MCCLSKFIISLNIQDADEKTKKEIKRILGPRVNFYRNQFIIKHAVTIWNKKRPPIAEFCSDNSKKNRKWNRKKLFYAEKRLETFF